MIKHAEYLCEERYLILLCTAHDVEEQVYAALVHYSQALQKGYFICKIIRREEALAVI